MEHTFWKKSRMCLTVTNKTNLNHVFDIGEKYLGKFKILLLIDKMFKSQKYYKF